MGNKDLDSERCPFRANQTIETPEGVAPRKGAWPPGPPAGSFGLSLARERRTDILGAIANWKRLYGDLVHVHLWPEHEIIVAGPEQVRQLLVEQHDELMRWERATKLNSRLLGHSVFVADGSAWRAKRAVMQASYSVKVVQQGIPDLTSTVQASFAAWPEAHPEWPIEAQLTTLTMGLILRSMFSSGSADDAREAEHALRDMQRHVQMQWFWFALLKDAMPWNRRNREARNAFRRLIEGQIQGRLAVAVAERPDDVLTRLLQLHAQDPEVWSLRAVADECVTAFLAGYATVATTLSWWCWCLATHPDVQTQARQNVLELLGTRPPQADDLASLGYLKQTLLETLRKYPAAPLLNIRRSRAPIALDGWKIPRRARFVVPVIALHHDARWFPEPDAFRPERFAPGASEIPRGAFIPFGVGPRICLGQHQAMAEMLCVTAMLLQRFKLHPAEGHAAPTPVYRSTFRPSPALKLRIAPIDSSTTVRAK